MTRTSYTIDEIAEEIKRFARLQREYKEQALAEIITKYDFIVGSEECKCKLMEVLPAGAKIICSPYIESPTTIYAIKKFDTMDLLREPQESEDKESELINCESTKCDNCVNHNYCDFEPQESEDKE